jgi:hypothetical protein
MYIYYLESQSVTVFPSRSRVSIEIPIVLQNRVSTSSRERDTL